MKVKTLVEIPSARGIIPAGQIIEIPPAVMEKLKGKVESIVAPPLFRGAAEIITPEGDRVWIITEPKVVKLIPSGAVFFMGDEIMQLKKAGKEAARVALMVKQVFPGAGPVEYVQASQDVPQTTKEAQGIYFPLRPKGTASHE